MLWNFLLAFYIVNADVIREDGYHNYEGQFTVKNKGRMLRVLMSFRNVKPEECALHCVRHLRCRTFNYRPGKKDCELTDEEFHKMMDVDTISHGWYNYGTPKRVNGGWSNWMYYTECTKTCGDGTRDQYRECDSPTPAHGGADCYGKMIRRIKCNIRGCPVNGGFGSWINSTDCSKSCGDGTLEQTRECDSPKPQHGGADCTGDNMRTVECNANGCPVNGGFGSWKNSTDCSKSCGGGTLEQTRECDSPNPQHGGADCTGDNRRTVECNTNGCPVKGGFGKWKNSTDCSKSCGGGTLGQTRECGSPQPQHGGADCTGEKTRSVECNTNGCPVNGGFGSWKNSTDCSKSCEGGMLRQTRECDSPKPQHGGAECAGDKRRTVECNTNGCPVDGGYSPWSDYGPCSATCGISIQVRRRSCTEPAPKGGGRSCKRFGTDTQTRTCRVAQPFCNCSSALQHGVSTLTLEFGHLNGKVDCGIYNERAVTYFSHDAEQICYFDSKNGFRSRNINYVNRIEFVSKAVEMFDNCKQTFHVKCANQDPEDSYFENIKGEGLHVHDHDCVGCYEVIKNDDVTREGDAYIVNKKYLPLVKMVFEDTDASVEFMEIKLDKLICW